MVEESLMSHKEESENQGNKPCVMQVLTRLNVGGITHQVLMLSEQLRSQGYDVRIAVGQCGEREGDCTPEALEKGFPVHHITHLSNQAGLVSDILACVELYKVFKRERPSIVHLYMFKARMLGAFAARLAGVPATIETLHGNILQGYYGRLTSLIILFGEWVAGWTLMQYVIVPSEGQRTELLEYRIAPKRKFLVQPVGFDATPYENLENYQHQLRQRCGVGDDQILVGIMARLVPIKGVEDFLKAVALLFQEEVSKNILFVVIGDGPLRTELENKADELGLHNRCLFLGRIDDARVFYADIDVFVMSSWNEGTPIGLLEAMAASKAIVATNVGGVPDMVIHEESALLVPPQDPKALAEAIKRLVCDSNMRVSFGEKARGRVKYFSINALRESTHRLYQDVLATRKIA